MGGPDIHRVPRFLQSEKGREGVAIENKREALPDQKTQMLEDGRFERTPYIDRVVSLKPFEHSKNARYPRGKSDMLIAIYYVFSSLRVFPHQPCLNIETYGGRQIKAHRSGIRICFPFPQGFARRWSVGQTPPTQQAKHVMKRKSQNAKISVGLPCSLFFTLVTRGSGHRAPKGRR